MAELMVHGICVAHLLDPLTCPEQLRRFCVLLIFLARL